ncbi:MAG: gamma-butyrobetaine hydroxylase-like domain-containing protein [Sneathiella sp.]|uniref:gamma-butyrobetaine hydroxylase-like domain-containing protein n=1 Tax=Sneathiella sp. TaxID=1964365 RepID=UPI0030027E81
MDSEVRQQGSSIIITWPDGQTNNYSFIWLRDNCQCSRCDPATLHEQLLVTADIGPDMAAAQKFPLFSFPEQRKWMPHDKARESRQLERAVRLQIKQPYRQL